MALSSAGNEKLRALGRYMSSPTTVGPDVVVRLTTTPSGGMDSPSSEPQRWPTRRAQRCSSSDVIPQQANWLTSADFAAASKAAANGLHLSGLESAIVNKQASGSHLHVCLSLLYVSHDCIMASLHLLQSHLIHCLANLGQLSRRAIWPALHRLGFHRIA